MNYIVIFISIFFVFSESFGSDDQLQWNQQFNQQSQQNWQQQNDRIMKQMESDRILREQKKQSQEIEELRIQNNKEYTNNSDSENKNDIIHNLSMLYDMQLTKRMADTNNKLLDTNKELLDARKEIITLKSQVTLLKQQIEDLNNRSLNYVGVFISLNDRIDKLEKRLRKR